MRLFNPVSALAALATTALVLTGCSGDDDSSAEPEATTSASAGFDEKTGVTDDGSGDKQRECKAKVEVSGGANATFKGKGESVQPANGQPAAYYVYEGKKGSIQVFAGADDIPTSAVVTVDGVTYTTDPEDPTGVEAGEDGTSATVDAVGNPTEGGSADIVAEFTCGN
ncbi:hypothetical protein I601_2144 [Nocardioides dokdonensis FR1436]|uniref:Lipoprotein antigen n=1 Tax=Nocardioides dokdonensis FR1436 TaxID=1300347 RepID=A0A1A9GJV0_9ACTN|nr:hypothetical protein [Nocardioides dokdonensis]ANH38569.1 hypothetical protein I601_2144 [Nocardioides dokdonensis FR1436]